MRHTYTNKGAYASCNDCNWELDSKNAQAVAAQHAKKYGHNVLVIPDIGITYLGRAGEQE